MVRIFSNPGLDAEERLRRLVTLMIKYATGNDRCSCLVRRGNSRSKA